MANSLFRMPIVRLVLIASTLLSISALARDGNENGGGGGDPLATEFVALARRVVQVGRDGAIPGIDPHDNRLAEALTEIQTSLEGREPKLIFPEGDTVECFGEAKLGCVKNGVIRIARQGWLSHPEQRAEVTAMELMIFAGVRGRYELGPLAAQAISGGDSENSLLRSFYATRARFATAQPATRHGLRLEYSWSCFQFTHTGISTRLINAFLFRSDQQMRPDLIFNFGSVLPTRGEDLFESMMNGPVFWETYDSVNARQGELMNRVSGEDRLTVRMLPGNRLIIEHNTRAQVSSIEPLSALQNDYHTLKYYLCE